MQIGLIAVVWAVLAGALAGRAPGQCVPQWLPAIGTPGVNGTVRALSVLPNGDLVVGGSFTAAGEGSANRVARWNGSGWSALPEGVHGPVAALVALPNGEVVAGGSFSSAGGTPASTPPPAPAVRAPAAPAATADPPTPNRPNQPKGDFAPSCCWKLKPIPPCTGLSAWAMNGCTRYTPGPNPKTSFGA